MSSLPSCPPHAWIGSSRPCWICFQFLSFFGGACSPCFASLEHSTFCLYRHRSGRRFTRALSSAQLRTSIWVWSISWWGQRVDFLYSWHQEWRGCKKSTSCKILVCPVSADFLFLCNSTRSPPFYWIYYTPHNNYLPTSSQYRKSVIWTRYRRMNIYLICPSSEMLIKIIEFVFIKRDVSACVGLWHYLFDFLFTESPFETILSHANSLHHSVQLP